MEVSFPDFVSGRSVLPKFNAIASSVTELNNGSLYDLARGLSGARAIWIEIPKSTLEEVLNFRIGAKIAGDLGIAAHHTF
jgi:hypothetical protein